MTAAREVSAVPQGRIADAIRSAATRTGVDFDYLYGQARSESGLNPNIRASGSTATGLFQFLDQTWLGMIDKHGAEHGYAWAANAVQRGANGRLYVADPALRQQVMNLRRNPEAASAMGAAYAADNSAYLQRRLGRELAPADLYMAHFLGAGGAAKFLRAHDTNPNAAAAGAFPDAARANRTIFYKRDGTARSYAEVRNMLGARLQLSGGVATATAARTTRQPTPVPDTAAMLPQFASLQTSPEDLPTSLAPRYARLAYLMLADMGA